MSGSHHEHLARLMDHRRLELGMKWDEVAAAAGVKPPTLRAIRNGTNRPSALTQRGLERALQWAPGTVERVLAGGTSTPTTAPSPMDQAEADIADAARRADELLATYRRLNDRGQQMLEDIARMLERSAEDAPAENRKPR